MRYRLSYYLYPIGEISRWLLYAMLCWPVAFAVLFFGIFAARMLQAFSIQQPIIDCVFLPCATYFLWSIAISIIDVEIEKDRDVL
jgi:hypothetical protein